MVEIRFHGLGGQSAVTSAELTALAAVAQGKYAEAFPNLRVEQRGAPVTAYVRVSDTPICTQEKASSPDIVVILDPILLFLENITADVSPESLIIVNTTKSTAEIRRETGIETRLAVVDARKTALEIGDISIGDGTLLDTLIIASPLQYSEPLHAHADHCFCPVGTSSLAPYDDLAPEEILAMEDALTNEMGPICWSELQPGAAVMLSA